ncbi:MAG: stage 0 sporulation protein [Christensenellaceae bacterium]|jgi:cell fate regulator YaaT (PSP1 superfamily)|nr:stage 0 sporulation protein [Christensenellaceae bacterium]
MLNIVGVKYKAEQKSYYFDPCGLELKKFDKVVVETTAGEAFGEISFGNMDIENHRITKQLMKVIRLATEDDCRINDKNIADRVCTMMRAKEICKANEIPMKIVDVDYAFDRSKVVILYTADDRVDFSKFIKKLSATVKIKIEMKQIFERDDVRTRGSLAVCGRPCCCITHMNEYPKVSMKMVKIQGMAGNPGRITGCCGKLMCCLKFENEVYTASLNKMPKINSCVTTPSGEGVVVGHNLLLDQVVVKVSDDDGYRFCKCGLSDISRCDSKCGSAMPFESVENGFDLISDEFDSEIDTDIDAEFLDSDD